MSAWQRFVWSLPVIFVSQLVEIQSEVVKLIAILMLLCTCVLSWWMYLLMEKMFVETKSYENKNFALEIMSVHCGFAQSKWKKQTKAIKLGAVF